MYFVRLDLIIMKWSSDSFPAQSVPDGFMCFIVEYEVEGL